MPSCRITNYTSQPLNVSLKHLCALHFENEVAPGQTVKLKPGRVWFTLEVLVDDKRNRYSMAQSAAAIAIVSLACVGTAALAVPTVAAASTAGVGSAILAHAGTVGTTVGTAVTSVGPAITGVGAGVFAVSDTLVAGFGTVYGAAQGFLAAHGATAAKLSAAFLPRAIDAVEKEVGGFTAVQKEVVAILSSPTVTEDVRKSGLSILSRLGAALAADRATEAEATAKELAEKEKEKEKQATLAPPPPYSKNAPSSSPSLSSRPSLKRLPSSVTTLLHNIAEERKASKLASTQSKIASTHAKQATKQAKAANKEAAEAASWEVVSIDEDVAAGKVLSSTAAAEHKRVCVHGLFMSERRHFEVREREGKLVLVDGNTGEVVVG